MKKFLITIGIMLLALCTMPVAGNAQVQIDPQYLPGYSATIPGAEDGNRGATPIIIILQLIAGSLIYAAGPVAVFMIALAGRTYVTSRGDQAQLDEAKKVLTWAILGLLVILISYAIVSSFIIGVTPLVGETG